MTFYDPTLYARDEEEEFGDSGAYSESLEEDFEEEEEEEESGTPSPETSEPESIAVPPPPAPRPRPTPSAPRLAKRSSQSSACTSANTFTQDIISTWTAASYTRTSRAAV